MRLLQIPPQPLLKARRRGELVIFAGAGVSIPPPSNLPTFKGLVEQIAGHPPPKDEPLDRFLGRLHQNGVPVHKKAACILGRPGSQPNDLHRLVVDFFPRAEDLRMITTNFDRHLEPRLSTRWPESTCPIHSAPALPVGSRFAGLVYLHGRLGSELVLTDEDFGRAYLTEGWARRFLTQVFATYDVLFVGYSHEDVILHYLARGLPPNTNRQRYALTESENPERWGFLGITPLEYEAGIDHAALRIALDEWVELEGKGPLGHEQKVRELVARPPAALVEQEETYLLKYCLPDLSLAHYFYRYTEGPEWLRWAAKHGLLALLLISEDMTDERAPQVAVSWFSLEPLSARGEVAREIAQSARRLSQRVWESIAHRIWRALDVPDVSESAAVSAARWLALLERHGNAASDFEQIGYWLKHLSAERHTFLIVQLFT